MNIINFELIDTQGKKYKINISNESSKLEINDMYILSLCKDCGIDKLKRCNVTIGANNMAFIVKDYTLTKEIYIDSFYNTNSCISMLQSFNVDIHIDKQQIKHLQADCKNILISDCVVDKFEVGLLKRFDLEKDEKNYNIFCMDVLDLRDSEFKAIDILAKCKTINIQRSNIGELNALSGMFTNKAEIESLHIWYNTHIDKLTLSNRIKKLKVDTAQVSRFYSHTNLLIENIELTDAVVDKCYGFNESNFVNTSYESWTMISISAQNSGNIQMRANANYEMLKYTNKMESKSDRFFGNLFDVCAGYGYKPFRIIRTSFIIIIINAIIYSIFDFFSILNKHSIQINYSNIGKAITHVWNNFLVSLASFIGQGSLSIADGIVYWFSVFEYLSGVILFAMFVNALYLRYK